MISSSITRRTIGRHRKIYRRTPKKRNFGRVCGGGGASISGCRAPPPYLSRIYQSPSLALAINKEELDQKKRSTASQLPDTRSSVALIHLGRRFTSGVVDRTRTCASSHNGFPSLHTVS